jgi:hypothetical protein
MDPDTIILRTVLVDGGKYFKPLAEIYGKVKMAWKPETAQTFETMPPSRGAGSRWSSGCATKLPEVRFGCT